MRGLSEWERLFGLVRRGGEIVTAKTRFPEEVGSDRLGGIVMGRGQSGQSREVLKLKTLKTVKRTVLVLGEPRR